MKILGIETSCDETSAAIIENGRKILSLAVSTSLDIHRKTGGIIPEAAAREQVKYIIPVMEKALGGKKNLKDIDALAVTIGPGLIGSLLVGVESAKTISFITGKPIVPVNHIFAHIYANWLEQKDYPELPALALVVSGGHTELFLLRNHGDIKWLGGTRDDAAGEAFDKTARLLGLGYPGGPSIAAEAAKFKVQSSKFKLRLPRPMINSNTLEFSFSGLKTAVMKEMNQLHAIKQWNNETISYLAYEIQESITDVLTAKTLLAVKMHKVKSILLGGGVAANKRLSEKMKLEIGNCPPAGEAGKLEIKLYIPPPNLCTDNAAYIASYAFFNYHPVPWRKIQARPDLEIEV